MKQKLISVITLGLLFWVTSIVIQNRVIEPRIRIMPLGDSITQGRTDADSYRKPLWEQLKKTNRKIDFVGSMKMNHPNEIPAHSDFDMDHEGHSGLRTDQVLAKIDGWAGQATPDIVLLHLGSNDIFQKQKNEATVEELRKIIIILRKHNPRVEIFLAQLIPTEDKTLNMRIQEFNRLLPVMAQSITNDESPVHIVNQFQGFDAFKDTYDGIHPNEIGIEKMAQRWHEALTDSLRFQR